MATAREAAEELRKKRKEGQSSSTISAREAAEKLRNPNYSSNKTSFEISAEFQEAAKNAALNPELGASGWQKYLDDLKKSEEDKKKAYEEEKWWQKLGRYLGNATYDTNLPTALTNQVINDLRNDTSHARPSDDWDEEQKTVFGYLYSTNPSKAYAYADTINKQMKTAAEEEAIRRVQESATGSFGAGLGHTIGAIATAPLGLADYLNDLVMMNAGREIAPDGTLSPFEYSQAVTSGISTHLNETGGVIDERIPIIGGKGWGDVYGLGTSIAQSLTSAYTLGGVGTLVSYFGQGAASGMDEALSRGANEEQAALYGTALGVFEGLAEMIGVDRLFKLGSSATVKGFIKNILNQAGAEGAEEGLTSLLSNIADNAIMQDKSNFNALVAQYTTQGMSPADAEKKAWLATVGDIAFDTIAGSVSGGVSGSIHTTAQNIASNKEAKETYGTGRNLVGEVFEESSEGSKAKSLAEKYQKTLDDGKNLSGAKLNRLAYEYNEDLLSQDTTKIKAAVEKRLASLGETGDIGQLAEIITKHAKGEKLSATEQSIIRGSYAGQRVANEITPKNIASGEYTSEWTKDIGTKRINADSYNKTLYDLAMEQAGVSTDEETPSATVDSTPTKEIAPEAKNTVSDDGKTVLIDTNEEVEIQGIASIENGKVKLRTNKGEVDSKDISFGTDDEALLYEAVTDMSAEAARNMVEAYDPSAGVSMSDYVHGFKDAYKYGFFGFAETELSKGNFTKDLSYTQSHRAYTVGKNAGEAAVKEAQAARTAAKKGDNAAPKKGKVYLNGKEYTIGKKTGLSGIRDTSVKGMVVLAESLGVDVHFYESYVKDGKRVYRDENGNVVKAPHGFYDASGIHIDLNAGKLGEGLILYTAAHELTHFIREWSPAKFKVFADFLLENYGKKGVTIEALVQGQIQKALKNDRVIDYDTAYEEVIADSCQSMLADGKAIQKLGDLKAKDATLWNKIKDFISSIVAKIRKAYEGLDPYSDEGRFVKQHLDVFEQLQSMWVDALVDAGETYSEVRDALGEDSTIKVNEDGEFLMGETADGKILFNDRTWDEGGREILRATLAMEGYSEEDIKAAMTIMDGKHALVEQLNKEFSEQDKISKATLTTDVKNGNAVLSALVSNGDYPVNIDLLMVCKKRQAYQRVINRLCETGLIKQATLDALAIAEINKILGSYGFETACLGCFVESRRIRIQEWAETICKEWNDIVDKMVGKGKAASFNFAEETFVKDLSNDEIEDLSNDLDSAYERDGLHYGRMKVVKKMEQLLREVPSLRKHLSVADLITPQGRTHLKQLSSELNSLVACRYGSNTPKIVQDFNPYNHELAQYGTVPTKYKSLREYLYAIGGARMQSFSDFIVENWFDYCQIVSDLAARKLPMHTYTKEIVLAKLFGMTGIKINLSLIPDIDKSMGKEYAGLTRNANGELELIWGDKDRHKATGGKSYMQSINFADALELMADPRYSSNVGTIAVGVSDKHILMMLDDPRIRMIIPYHSSGMNPIFANLVGTEYYTDYTDFQNPTVRQLYDSKGNKVTLKLEKSQKDNLVSGFDFNAVLQELGDARATAKAYLEWCADASKHSITIDGETYTAVIKPEFEQFSDHENYYKVLEDFNTYDCITEQAAPQGDVQQIYPDEFEDILRGELTVRENYRQKQEPKWDAAMAEIESYLKHHTKKDTLAYAKEHGIKLSAKDKKLSDRDSDYLDAVNRGDMETAQRMVDAAAKNAGYTTKGYHGTGEDFNVFSEDKVSKRNVWGKGFYFGTSKGIADDYASWRASKGGKYRIVSAYLKFDNPYIPSKSTLGSAEEILDRWFPDMWQTSRELGVGYINGKLDGATLDLLQFMAEHNGLEVRDVLTEYGYDGVKDGGELVAFSSEQIKSADPVTYDDSGNVIPLSKRFDSKESDIRYSDRTDVVDINGKEYDHVIELDYNVFNRVKRSGKAYIDFIRNNLINQKITVYNSNGDSEVVEFARANERVKKDGTSRDHVVIGELTQARNEIKKLVILNAVETAEISSFDPSADHSDENSHQWLDANGWDKRTSYVMTKDGMIYPVTLFIAKARDGRNILYDVNVQIKEGIAAEKSATSLNAKSNARQAFRSTKPSSERIIPQDSDSVKRKFSDRDSYAPVFYSHMGKTIDDIKIAKMGAGGVVPYLKGRGVKDEEIKWSGIEAFLEGKKSVTKEELQEFVAGSQLQIVEQMAADEGNADIVLHQTPQANVKVLYIDGKYEDIFRRNESGFWVSDELGDMFFDEQEIIDQVKRDYARNVANTKWSDYKLDGGSNYRELVFQMPNNSYSNQMMRVHWGLDAEGVLAHARMQDMDTSDGKMLFIEEIQSDYHNEGAKDGYIDSESEAKIDELKAIADERYFALEDYSTEMTGMAGEWETIEKTQKGAKLLREYREAKAALDNAMNEWVKKIPDAPFKDTYHEYVLKRLIRMAAEEGYDIIGWTPAEIQDKRWADGQYHSEGKGKSGNLVGYTIEYDQDMPKFLKKYGKKWGATVGETTINGNTQVWSMPITDSMKQSVLREGQPLYSDRSDSDISNRELLANALEAAATNDIERNKLAQYKQKIALINAEEKKLHELKAKIGELSFAKGRKDVEQIKKLQFEAKQCENRINTYDRQLLNLEASAPLKAVLEREKKIAYKKAEKRGKDALAAYREKAAADKRKLLERAAESRQKGIEGRRKTEMRHKIKKVVSDLDHLLRHGSKERNVKLGLQAAVASALEAVNMDTVAADERIAALEKELMQAKTPEKIQEISRKIDHIREQGDRMKSKLEALRQAYVDIKTAEEGIPDYYKNEATLIADKVDSVMKKVGDTPLRNMSLAQLEEVHNLYKMVLTTVRNVNSLFVQGKLDDLHQNVSEIMTEEEAIKPLKEERLAIGDWWRKQAWSEMIPVYAFEKLGSKKLMKFFWEVVRGQNTFAVDVNEAKEFSSAAREKYGYAKWDLDKIHEFKVADGRTFRISLRHMMSIYAYSKRDQALDHMSVGGFFFNDKETFRKEKGVLKVIKSNEAGYKVNGDLLAEITAAMEKEAEGSTKYVDEMQEYLTKMGAKGNEVSRVLWGIDIFKEKVYFPLKSSRDFIYQANQPAQESSLKNDGMTKETVPHASNPIVLESFDDVWASHVERMSKYHAFVLPIENLNKIMNYGTWIGTDSLSLSTMIRARHSDAANEYITQFIRDLNGASSMGGVTNPVFGFFNKFKKTAVAASASVVVQQPTAILRALAVMDAKHFIGMPHVKTLATKWGELQKYAPIAIIKDIGGFDAGGGRQISEWLNADTKRGLEKAMGKLDDITMLGAALGDQIGWTTIWEAVKREIKSTTNLKEGSEEFLQKAGERFTEVIVLTQVYDSTLSRSGFMRSKHESVKMMTSFMGEPTVSFNMLMNAVLQVKGKKITKRQAARTIGAVYASIVAASIAASMVYALRDDDDDESYLEKLAESLSGKLKDEINPINMLPITRDIMSIMDGWDVERTDVAIFKDIKDAFDGLSSENKSTWRKIEDFAGALASVFGIPAKNMLRTGREIYNLFENTFDGVAPNGVGDAFVRGITGEKKDKGKALYEAIVNGDDARLAIYRKGYKTEKSYETAVRSALRENDPRIKEAAQAIVSEDFSKYTNLANQIIGEKNFSESDIVSAIKSEVNAMTKDEDDTEEETEDKEVSLYEMDYFYSSVVDGDAVMAEAIREDIIRTKVANGKEREEAEKNFNSSFQTRCRKEYEAGNLSASEAIRMLVLYGGKTEKEARSRVQAWD